MLHTGTHTTPDTSQSTTNIKTAQHTPQLLKFPQRHTLTPGCLTTTTRTLMTSQMLAVVRARMPTNITAALTNVPTTLTYTVTMLCADAPSSTPRTWHSAHHSQSRYHRRCTQHSLCLHVSLFTLHTLCACTKGHTCAHTHTCCLSLCFPPSLTQSPGQPSLPSTLVSWVPARCQLAGPQGHCPP